MNKIKNIIGLIVLSVVLYSCGNSNGIVNPYADFDYEAQALIDNDTLTNFLKNHYFDETKDSVVLLVSGKTSLFDDEKLVTMNVSENDIDYELFVYVTELGDPSPDPDKGNPSIVDSVFVKYYGQQILSTESLGTAFDFNTNGIWFTLNSVIKGWSYGYKNFKGGSLKKEPNGDVFNGPITYLNVGKGILFIPSGLAYPSSNVNNYSNSLINQNIMFYMDLLDFVADTDHDNDGRPSMTEDADGDGDPSNDFSDSDNPTTPDYLNPNI